MAVVSRSDPVPVAGVRVVWYAIGRGISEEFGFDLSALAGFRYRSRLVRQALSDLVTPREK